MIAALMLAVSTFPPMLPRGIVTQLVESAVLTAIGWRIRPSAPGSIGVALVGAWSAVTLGIQDVHRHEMGLAVAGWVPVVVAATVAVLALRHRALVRPPLIAGALCLVLGLGAVAAAPAPASVAASCIAPKPARSVPPPAHIALSLGAGAPTERADAAVRALHKAGGLMRRTVVVVVPTGSGWVDPAALATLDAATGGDVATVTLAYDDAPSWISYLTGRAAAADTTEALLTAVAQAKDPRTRVLLYGQSLGALIGADAWTRSPTSAEAALWVGPPADTHTAGPGGRSTTVLTHTSDPVAVWSPRLLVAPPNRPTGTPWVPVVSFLQTSIDLLAAVGAPAGHGHHYGDEHRAAWDSVLNSVSHMAWSPVVGSPPPKHISQHGQVDADGGISPRTFIAWRCNKRANLMPKETAPSIASATR